MGNNRCETILLFPCQVWPGRPFVCFVCREGVSNTDAPSRFYCGEKQGTGNIGSKKSVCLKKVETVNSAFFLNPYNVICCG